MHASPLPARISVSAFVRGILVPTAPETVPTTLSLSPTSEPCSILPFHDLSLGFHLLLPSFLERLFGTFFVSMAHTVNCTVSTSSFCFLMAHPELPLVFLLGVHHAHQISVKFFHFVCIVLWPRLLRSGIAHPSFACPIPPPATALAWISGPLVCLRVALEYGCGVGRLPGITACRNFFCPGCVLVELLTGEALFPGKNELDQLDKITSYIAVPAPPPLRPPSPGSACAYFFLSTVPTFHEEWLQCAAEFGHWQVWCTKLVK